MPGDSRVGGVSWGWGWRRAERGPAAGVLGAGDSAAGPGQLHLFPGPESGPRQPPPPGAMWEPIWLMGCGCPGRGQVAAGGGGGGGGRANRRGAVGSKGALRLGLGWGSAERRPPLRARGASEDLGDSAHAEPLSRGAHTRTGAQSAGPPGAGPATPLSVRFLLPVVRASVWLRGSVLTDPGAGLSQPARACQGCGSGCGQLSVDGAE